MEWDVSIRKQLPMAELKICAAYIGRDLLICLQGGAAHIGCTVQAIPRPSLTGDGTVSATSSVLNLTGHKDEELCRKLAEYVCRQLNTVVVCTGGFHIDDITSEQIQAVAAAADAAGKELVKMLQKTV